MRNPIVRSARFSRLTARLIAIFSFVGLLYGPSPALAQTLPDFAALGGPAVTCTNSTITGDVGAGTPLGVVTQTNCPVSGTVHPGDTIAQQAYADFQSAYAVVGGQMCTATVATLTNQTLPPGVYCVTAATATGTLTLDDSSGPGGTWIFKFPAAFTATGFSVVGTTCPSSNVVWWTGAAVTLTGSNLLGSILSGAAITTTTSSLNGQALATAAVTLTGGNVFAACGITLPPPPPVTMTTTTTLPSTTTTTMRPRPRVCEDDEDHRYHHNWRRGEDQRHEHRGRGDGRDREYCKDHHPRRKSKGRQ